MIRKLRDSRAFKGLALAAMLSLITEIIYPTTAMALTGGPAQPEFNSFTPVGTSDMVDLASGDMSYNIPLMDVGGYPLNLAYSSGVSMDQEASHVGLGWNLSMGQINRNVRGIPDDFKGDEMIYENNLKPNVTIGANFNFEPNLFGWTDSTMTQLLPSSQGLSFNSSIAMNYNNYSGFSASQSLGANLSIGERLSVGLSVQSGADGLSLSPNVSLQSGDKIIKGRKNKLGLSVGTTFNSRQGVKNLSLNATRKAVYETKFSKRTHETAASAGSSISFTNTSYTPEIRNKMTTSSFTVNAALGAEFFGGEGQGQVTAYGTVQKLANSEKNKKLKAYGYSNTELASNKEVILDVNREKDGNVTVNTTNLPLTNYTYDIQSVQGQGVGGTYRAYRSQVGYVYDSEVKDLSLSGTIGFESGVGNAAHLGVDGEVTVSNGSSGVWEDRNAAIDNFTKNSNGTRDDYEHVSYKNVGDLSTDQEINVFENAGGYSAVRLALTGGRFARSVDDVYEKKVVNGLQTVPIQNTIKRTKRQLRNQAILNLTKKEVEAGMGMGPISHGTGASESLPSDMPDYHHAEVQITRNDGARYIYGLPAFNLKKVEASFAVKGNTGDCSTGLVNYKKGVDNSVDNKNGNHYFNRVTTPIYAHTYLLTSVVSQDYEDLTGNGPSDDDLGSYTKFTYSSADPYRWRIPYSKDMGSFNEGLKTELSDDQANYTYGEKELRYVTKIETKTHVAIISYSDRQDALGVLGENGGKDVSQRMQKINKISLYAKPEYDQQGVNAIPIKTAHMIYSYDLCSGIPNNSQMFDPEENEISNNGGKLTLIKVYFTYRESKMGKYTGYNFNYDMDNNPAYNHKGFDLWGNYKPNTGSCGIAGEPTAPEFNYVEQDDVSDEYAKSWSLKSIGLPSGGVIDIDLESDDYGYVQNKHSQQMFKVLTAGRTPDVTEIDLNEPRSSLYRQNLAKDPSLYLFVEYDEDNLTAESFKRKYLEGLHQNQLYFRFFVNMTKSGSQVNVSDLDQTKFDYVSGYCELNTDDLDCVLGTFDGGRKYAAIPIKTVDKGGGVNPQDQVNPISKAAWNFGRKYLNEHVYSSSPNGDTDDVEEIVYDLLSPSIITNLLEVFKGPNGALQDKYIGHKFITSKSWIRLMNPDGRKKGGGCRVREIKMSDIWSEMNGSSNEFQTMNYGQVYDYNLENSNFSSGVATYEPVGGKENPFVQPVAVTQKHLLAPDEENYVERPFGESFFPSPQVTYSRVSVSNRRAGENQGSEVKRLNKTGNVVTQFYTSKDYPTIVDQTPINVREDKTSVLGQVLKVNIRKHITATQGYVIHLNDMNGKQRSQRVYAEGQSDYISGVDYNYETFGAVNPNDPFSISTAAIRGKLDNRVRVIYPDGSIKTETIGVEYDVINDFRESKSATRVVGVNANSAGFLVGVFPAIIPTFFPDFASNKDQLRTASTTKVINSFGILRETVAHDAGASVSTRNLAWDALTGEVLVTETIDEYADKYYSFNYPAHWYYNGMGQASKNLGIEGQLNYNSGNNYSMNTNSSYGSSFFLANGDEIEVINGSNYQKAWIVNMAGNNFDLIDLYGDEVVISGTMLEFKVIRSSRRNLQSSGISSLTMIRNPLLTINGAQATGLTSNFAKTNLSTPDDWKIIDAGAIFFSDKWEAQCECGQDLNGTYNPYVYNERGVWRPKASYTYLTGRNNASENPTPRIEGYYTTYSPFYQLTSGGNWYKNPAGWTFTSEVSIFSPYGFELENKDALNRYSGAQYGYNHTFPMAVGANTKYTEIGFDGFEDYSFEGCNENEHFGFRNTISPSEIDSTEFHTGKHSLRVSPNSTITQTEELACPAETLQP